MYTCAVFDVSALNNIWVKAFQGEGWPMCLSGNCGWSVNFPKANKQQDRDANANW